VFFRLSHPDGSLLAPLVDVLPLAIATPMLAFCASLIESGTHSGKTRHVARIGASALFVFLVLAGLMANLPLSPSAKYGTWLWFVSSVGLVGATHILWHCHLAYLRKTGRLIPNIVIVGATPNAARLIAHAAESGKIAVLGVFDDRLGRAPADIGGVPVLGDTQALLAHRVMPYIDRIVITVPTHAQDRVRALIHRLQYLPNEVSLFLDFDGQIEPAAVISNLSEMPLARLSGHRIDESRLVAKRLQDLGIGAIATLVAAPIMLLVAIAIKLDSSGPILFRQRRHGFNNETIEVWKFRSMHHDMADATASRQISANDARVTPVGRFIRRTSLDELPQFINVLRGEMSLVGPRPHAIGMKTAGADSARLVAEYAHRHRIKPGITSWAAIQGSRGPLTTSDDISRRVALDIAYIERQSFWLDIYIMFKTLPCMLGDRQAIR
jgi:Undecaprenyl-phosphate glucose phosphotransferase